MIGQINTHIQKPGVLGGGGSDLLQGSVVNSPNSRIGTGPPGQDKYNNQQATLGGNGSILSTPLKNKSVPLNLSINQGLIQA